MKKFLIIGNMNACTYKEVFPHMISGEICLGYSISSGDREFRVPDDYPLYAARTRVDKDGTKYVRVTGVRWFSNLKIDKGNTVQLTSTYNGQEYRKYDGYDAINCDKVKDIPYDFEGKIGAPVTILDKLSTGGIILNGHKYRIIGKADSGKTDRFNLTNPFVNGKEKYKRIMIERV